MHDENSQTYCVYKYVQMVQKKLKKENEHYAFRRDVALSKHMG